jgi:hypothetical protein
MTVPNTINITPNSIETVKDCDNYQLHGCGHCRVSIDCHFINTYKHLTTKYRWVNVSRARKIVKNKGCY